MRKNLVLIGFVIVILILAGVFYSRQHKNNQVNTGKILSDKDQHLSASQQQIYLDRIKKAEESIKSLKVKDPSYHTLFVNGYTYLGQQYYGLGKLEKAKQEYLTVLKIDANNEAALVGLALVFTGAKDFENAKTSLETALKSNPKNYNIWLQYIDVLKTSGASNDDIIGAYQKALDATKQYPDIITRDAQLQESIGGISQAITLWQEAVKQNPSGADLYNKEISRLQKLTK